MMIGLTNVHAVIEKVAPVLVKVGGHFMSKSTAERTANCRTR
jgi:hypothetical protein